MLRLCTLAFIVILGTTAFAQGKKGMHKMKADSAFAKVSERLKLTEGQQTKLREVMKQNREEMKAVRESNKDAAKPDKRKAMLAQLKKSDERINGILDESQKAEYAKLKEEKKAQMKAKRAERQKAKPQGGADDELMDDGLL